MNTNYGNNTFLINFIKLSRNISRISISQHRIIQLFVVPIFHQFRNSLLPYSFESSAECLTTKYATPFKPSEKLSSSLGANHLRQIAENGPQKIPLVNKRAADGVPRRVLERKLARARTRKVIRQTEFLNLCLIHYSDGAKELTAGASAHFTRQ